jgi:hypothetical protein
LLEGYEIVNSFGNKEFIGMTKNYLHNLLDCFKYVGLYSSVFCCGSSLQPIERLGQAGQIVKVAPGFARNCLMPNKLALPAIEKFVLLVQNQLKVISLIHLNFPDLQIVCTITYFILFY